MEKNNEQFGKFLNQLRKEKGWTQKELARSLFVSDKAVSKWERGLSMPDVALLLPLSELLGVSTTELLSGKRLDSKDEFTREEVERMVQKTLVLTGEEEKRRKRGRKSRQRIFFAALLILAAEVFVFYQRGYLESDREHMLTMGLLMLFFGVYFSFFVKESLPSYYDEHKIHFYSDGFLRINMVGLRFNNSNWQPILRTFHAVIMIELVTFLPLYLLAARMPGEVGKIVLTVLSLLLLFVPVYIVGKKHE
ncbi:MAG: helix-turn-helix transcriptional regulator [Peptostreptococcaceae bacterium]|nr:helix-turn-helix transcriptional regulator [Peptostreptococcaceae bacterium]